MNVHLTRRELEVVQQLVQDQPMKEIAERMHLSVSTIGVHTANIYTKLGVGSRVGVLRWALRNGIVDSSEVTT